jgi:hypothetical protein
MGTSPSQDHRQPGAATDPVELAPPGMETHSQPRNHVEPHGPLCSILYVLCPHCYIGLIQVSNDFRHYGNEAPGLENDRKERI